MLNQRYESPLLRSRRTLSPDQSTTESSLFPDAPAEGSAAKRARLEIDSKTHDNDNLNDRPILSSSYRPRAREPEPSTSNSLTSLKTSTSSSFSLAQENLVTPTFPPPPPPSKQNSDGNNNNFNSYRPNHSLPPKPSVSLPPDLPSDSTTLPPISFSTLSKSDLASKLDSLTSSLPPFLSSLPPRPSFAALQTDGKAPESAGKTESTSTAIAPPTTDSKAPPTAEEIRRRADEVIARLTGSSSAPAPALLAGPTSTPQARPLHESVDDVIARLERETRAREASYATARVVRPSPGPTIFRPPFPPYPMAYPGPPPPGAMMRPPPPGWRPPPGFRPPPGWRPPPFPPNMAPGTTVPMSPAPAPLSPAVSVSSQSTSAPLPNPEEAVPTEAEEPILLPKKPRSPSASSAPPKDRKPNPENQIYIGNLPHSTQLATLRKAFEAISPILTIELKAPYAMIEFEKDHMAQEAVDVYDEGTFGGVQIRVERATESEA